MTRRIACAALIALGCGPSPSGQLALPARTPATGPLRRSDTSPFYFVTAAGKPVYLAGAHTWSDLQDNGPEEPPPAFDYEAFLDSLTAWGHNAFRLWTWEQARWSAETAGDYYFAPLPFARTGPGLALDGKPRFDLDRFDDAYFDRLRARVRRAGERGFYVIVMLFNGWSIETKAKGLGNPWRGHPFNAANNVNGVDGDPDRDGVGLETHTMALPPVLARQEAYVRRVVEALDDLDNVLYEIANESPSGSEPWQYHFIDFIHRHEAGLPRQHPVGMTVTYPRGDSRALLAGAADWISPNRQFLETSFPTPAEHGRVVLEDTDHLCGVCKDAPWAWEALFRGSNPLFMDVYDGKGTGVGARPDRDPRDRRWIELRAALGLTRALAERVDIGRFRPVPDLASTHHVLATGDGSEILVYAPAGGLFSVDLRGHPYRSAVEWIRPRTGAVYRAPSVPANGRRWLVAPFEGPAIARLKRQDLPG